MVIITSLQAIRGEKTIFADLATGNWRNIWQLALSALICGFFWELWNYRSLAKCGRLVLFGFSSAAVGKRSGTLSALRTLARVPWFQLNPIRLMNDNKSIAGVNLGRMWDQQERTSAWMIELLGMLADGRIAPVVDGVYSFDEAGLAHRRLEDRLNVGKVILVPRKAASV